MTIPEIEKTFAIMSEQLDQIQKQLVLTQENLQELRGQLGVDRAPQVEKYNDIPEGNFYRR